MKFATSLALAGSAALASASIISETEIVERDVSEQCTYGTTGIQAQLSFVSPLVSPFQLPGDVALLIRFKV